MLHLPLSSDKLQSLHFLKLLRHMMVFFSNMLSTIRVKTMLACFGLPPWTHENEAQNALRAALMFRRTFNACPIAISVTSGTILFATLGNAVRSEASLLGDVVNQAARLLTVAEDGYAVVCDESTRLATSEFCSETLGFLQLKGMERLVEVWHVVSAPEEWWDTQKFEEPIKSFGYRVEKERLMADFACWKSERRNTVVLIEGPSGFGKSTLVEFFAHQMKLQGIQMIISRGLKELTIVPFSGLRTVMQHILITEIHKFNRHQQTGDVERRSRLSLADSIFTQRYSKHSHSLHSGKRIWNHVSAPR
ncbi:nucleotide cyclase [Chytridium lagenaria]|nr:nucleotide cyclase [Chytridium lagenaria]